MGLVQRQFLLFTSCHLSQNHGFSHIVQDVRVYDGKLLENSVRQTLEADNINIHHAVVRMQRHNLLLCLHGKLLRDNGKILRVRILNGIPD